MGLVFPCLSPSVRWDPPGVAALSPALRDALLRGLRLAARRGGPGSGVGLVCAGAPIFARKGDSVTVVLNVFPHSFSQHE